MTVKWDMAALAKAVGEDAAVNDELKRIAVAKARECSAEAATRMHSPMHDDAFDAHLRQSKDGWPYAVVVPSHKAGAAINRKYGVLRW